jgi:hypothetical protein
MAPDLKLHMKVLAQSRNMQCNAVANAGRKNIEL